MDSTKAPCAAVTMVKGDYFFLKRWLDYYTDQFGRENLYVISHGPDPKVSQLAKGANVITMPFDPTRTQVERKRWQLLSHFTSGLTSYYNWVLCNDVDEIVAVDPDIAQGLLEYFSSIKRPARVISPMGLETVHNPKLEKTKLTSSVKILKARRSFRLNSNYAKPCIVRVPLSFSVGGHSCSEDRRVLDTNLFLFHLRFVDYDISVERLKTRQEMRNTQDGDQKATKRNQTTWDQALDSFMLLSEQKPVAEQSDFPEFAKIMRDGKRSAAPGKHWFFGGGRSKELYRLPKRFSKLF